MRSFVAFLACTGFIAWAHSCDTRIFGVKLTPPAAEPKMAVDHQLPVFHQASYRFSHDLQEDTVLHFARFKQLQVPLPR